MRNKINILFFLIFIFAGVIFCDTVGAATIFTDNFDSYVNNKSLNGQGSWVTDSPNVFVENYMVIEGTQAFQIYEPYPGSFFAEKEGKSRNDGMITIYLRKIIGGTTNPKIEIQLKEGATVMVSTKNQTYFQYLNGEANSYLTFGTPFSSEQWYALQIQWRGVDHKVRYNIDGGIWTDWASGMASWTKGLDTVSIQVTDGVAFFDAMQENLIGIVPKTPVLIVPGLLGTEIKKGNELLWADPTKMIVSVTDDFMDLLAFDKDLTPSDSTVFFSDVIKSITAFDYTDSLTREFKSQGYAENENLFTFPYDWRYGVTGKFADGTTNVDLLAQKIKDILELTESSKVDVVAHSMGGLVVKKFVMDHPTDNSIGKAVFVGVPNTGAPKSVKALLQGDNFGVSFGPFGLNDSEMKKIAENMPSAYDLLPSQTYYDAKGSYIKTIDQTQCQNDYTIPCEVKDLSHQEAGDFLNSQGFNSLAISNAENLHTEAFDNFDLRTAGINLYAIDGCKSATLSKIITTKYSTIFGQEISYDVRLAPGDGTVPLESATNLPIDQANKYYSLTSSHAKLMSADGTRQQIVNLLSGSKLVSDGDLVTQDISKCGLNGKAISVFSPVNIFVTDQNGNRLGLADDGSVINEIVGADFEILGEHKFLFLPTDAGQIYTISLAGTGVGSFTLKAEDIQNSQTVKTEVFSNLPVTLELIGSVVINPTDGATSLEIEQTSASDQQTILPDATLAAGQVDDYLPPNSIAILTGEKNEDGIYKSEVKVGIKSTDNNSGVLALRYNLDNAGYQKISGDSTDLTVSAEGKHVLTFFGTDKAGNNEVEQKIEFEIKFPPPPPTLVLEPAVESTVLTEGGGGSPIVYQPIELAPTPISVLVPEVIVPVVVVPIVEPEIKLPPVITNEIIPEEIVIQPVAEVVENEMIVPEVATKRPNPFLASLGSFGGWFVNLWHKVVKIFTF